MARGGARKDHRALSARLRFAGTSGSQGGAGGCQTIVQAHLILLAAEGCRAPGYALSGPEPWPRICCKHIGAEWRVLVAFTEEGAVVILRVARHTVNDDPYEQLAHELLDVPVPTEPRKKPPCCDGAPNVLPPDLLAEIQRTSSRLVRQGRRGR